MTLAPATAPRFALAALLLVPLAVPAAAQLGPTGTQFWTADSPDIATSAQADSAFGAAAAAGDFDCDGFDDLAIGVPEDDDNNGALVDVGYVLVLYGAEGGLAADDNQLWDQQSLAQDTEEADDLFGETLAAGDFDGDGCDDLAIGSPEEDIGSETDAGGVQVVYGSFFFGLVADGNVFFRQGDGAISSIAEEFDNFGAALAVGDFDGDGFDDLSIGVPGEDNETAAVGNSGAVHVLFGSGIGLTGTGDLILFRGSGLPGSAVEGELVGAALAAGDFVAIFAGDDLAIGAPRATAGSVEDSGAVLLVSDLTGSLFVGNFSQATAGVPGVEEEFDEFGASLAAGDFDGDGVAELAVGSPGEDLEGDGVTNAGAVTILDFDGDGHGQILQSDFPFEEPSNVDEFGRTLVAADFEADGADDLAIGVPLEDLGPINTAGIVHVVYGAPGDGLDLATAENWLQTIDPSENPDRFGGALAAGRFSGHTGYDLAIGARGETVGGEANAGAINVVHSDALFVDGFENGLCGVWSAFEGTIPCV